MVLNQKTKCKEGQEKSIKSDDVDLSGSCTKERFGNGASKSDQSSHSKRSNYKEFIKFLLNDDDDSDDYELADEFD